MAFVTIFDDCLSSQTTAMKSTRVATFLRLKITEMLEKCQLRLLESYSPNLPTPAIPNEQEHAEIDSLNSTVAGCWPAYRNRISSSFTKQHPSLHLYIRCSYDSLVYGFNPFYDSL